MDQATVVFHLVSAAVLLWLTWLIIVNIGRVKLLRLGLLGHQASLADYPLVFLRRFADAISCDFLTDGVRLRSRVSKIHPAALFDLHRRSRIVKIEIRAPAAGTGVPQVVLHVRDDGDELIEAVSQGLDVPVTLVKA